MTRPTVTASSRAPKPPVSMSAKKGNIHSPTPTAPIRYTGRRPSRSDRAPQAGITAKCTAEAMSTALRAVCLDTPAEVVAYTRMNAVIT